MFLLPDFRMPHTASQAFRHELYRKGAELPRLSRRAARRVRAGALINLKNVPNKNHTQLHIDATNLAGLIDLIATIPFQHADLHAKRILGHFLSPDGAAHAMPGQRRRSRPLTFLALNGRRIRSAATSTRPPTHYSYLPRNTLSTDG